jgi:hypothetical protein
MMMQSSESDRQLRRVIAGAVQAGVAEGHIWREARATAACFPPGWALLSTRERLEYAAEAAGIAVEVHVA